MNRAAGRRLVFTNRKGGCGKTTTSVNVAAALAHLGHRVLVVDTDPQAHATMSLGVAQRSIQADLSAVLMGDATAAAAVQTSYVTRLHVIPSSRRLADFERRHADTADAVHWMRNRLDPLMDQYDYTVIDTPPTTQVLTLGALVAGREAYIPMQAHFLAMEGMIEIIELVEEVQATLNSDLQIRGIIPTFYDDSAEFSQQIVGELNRRLGEGLILKPVRLNNALAEAPGAGHTIFQHDLRSPGALDYYRVALQIRSAHQPRQI